MQRLNSTVYARAMPDSVKDQLPGRIRIGDIDADGFPDLLMTLQTADLKANRTVIFLNKRPEVQVASQGSASSQMSKTLTTSLKTPYEENRRYYIEQTKEYNLAFFGGSESVLGTFNDVDEDGRMDVLLQTK